MKMRKPGAVGDTFCDAFKAYVPVMLWAAYSGAAGNPDNQTKVIKVLLLLPFPRRYRQ